MLAAFALVPPSGLVRGPGQRQWRRCCCCCFCCIYWPTYSQARDVRTAKLHQNSHIKQFNYTAQLDSSEQQSNTIKNDKICKNKTYIYSHITVSRREMARPTVGQLVAGSVATAASTHWRHSSRIRGFQF